MAVTLVVSGCLGCTGTVLHFAPSTGRVVSLIRNQSSKLQTYLSSRLPQRRAVVFTHFRPTFRAAETAQGKGRRHQAHAKLGVNALGCGVNALDQTWPGPSRGVLAGGPLVVGWGETSQVTPN